MSAFENVQKALKSARWPSDEVYNATVNLLKSIEKDADEVGFEVGDATEEAADTLQELLIDLDEANFDLDDAETEDDDDDEDELSGFGEADEDEDG